MTIAEMRCVGNSEAGLDKGFSINRLNFSFCSQSLFFDQVADLADTLDVYGMLVKYSQLHIFRAVEPMLTRRYMHRWETVVPFRLDFSKTAGTNVVHKRTVSRVESFCLQVTLMESAATLCCHCCTKTQFESKVEHATIDREYIKRF